MKRLIKTLYVFLLMFAVVSTIASAEEGVTDTSIKIGNHMDLSGPAASWGNSSRIGMEAYFKFINESGGVYGRKIDFITEDDQYKPPLALAAAKKLIAKDNIFAFVAPFGSQQAVTTMKLAMEKKIPFMFPITNNIVFSKPLKRYVFAMLVPYYFQTRVIVDYALEKLRVREFGMIYQQDEVGEDARRGVLEQLKKYGKELSVDIPFTRGTKDFSSQVLKLKESGVDAVIIGSMIKEPASIIKEAAKLNWNPQFFCIAGAAIPIFIKLVGAAGEGTIVATQAFLPDLPTPGMFKYKEILDKFSPKLEPTYMNQVGYAVAMTFTEGLKLAGPNPSREKLIDAIEHIKNFDTGVLPPISFSPTKHLGAEGCFLLKIEGGKFVKITDYVHAK